MLDSAQVKSARSSLPAINWSFLKCPTTGNGQCTAYFQFPPRNGVGGQGGKGSNPKQAEGGGGNGSGGSFQGDGSGAAQAGSASDGNGGAIQ